jgi:hypothetical protein
VVSRTDRATAEYSIYERSRDSAAAEIRYRFAALEAGKAVDEKPEPDAMSTEDHIKEIRSANKLTAADYGLVINNE